MEFDAWVNHMKPDWLTVKDVLQLTPGQSLKVLVLDRNVRDIACEATKGGTSYTPRRFFRNNHAVFTRDDRTDRLTGTLKWWTGSTNDEFEFHLNYKEGHWYPMRNGVLPANDWQWSNRPLLGKRLKLDKIPLNWHVGWRGPMIPWAKLAGAPRIVWFDEGIIYTAVEKVIRIGDKTIPSPAFVSFHTNNLPDLSTIKELARKWERYNVHPRTLSILRTATALMKLSVKSSWTQRDQNIWNSKKSILAARMKLFGVMQKK